MADSIDRPHLDDVPGMWPSASANIFRQEYLAHGHLRGSNLNDEISNVDMGQSQAKAQTIESSTPPGVTEGGQVTHVSSEDTRVPSRSNSSAKEMVPAGTDAIDQIDTDDDEDPEINETGGYAPIKTSTNKEKISKRPKLSETLSKQLTNRSGRQGSYISPQATHTAEDLAEIEQLMSRMFGKNRQEHSEVEKTRHVGVVFKDITVKGVGLGAALQPTLGDIFLGLPRLIQGLIGQGPKIGQKPPVRTIVNQFTGSVRPGEMLLVLGKPGSGCSTFLKVLANQRFGYESIQGDVTYGGTDAKTMGKHYRGEVVYNPEDDLHYATISVKNTLNFALKSRTPGKESRNEGESALDYRREFRRIVAKLFWIEHTLRTKVGDEYVRGVSGGEKKRVSIAEAMITKASIQCWDNSTRGLDASTALEYVQSLRSLTTMAHISTSVALYQAGESLYDLFDKVVLIDEGRCLYYGSTQDAATYFENLGFARPARWTTADFVSFLRYTRFEKANSEAQLTSVTDEHEREIKPGYEDRIPRSTEQFEDAYRKSDAFQNNLADIGDFEQELEEQKKARLETQSKAIKEKNYTLPFYKQVITVTHRQFLIMFGDQQSLVGKWGGILFQSLIVGSLFYNMPKTSAGVFPRGGVLFFMLLFNALLALAELTAEFASRTIMLKHKSLWVISFEQTEHC